jgi:hypothetical protein
MSASSSDSDGRSFARNPGVKKAEAWTALRYKTALWRARSVTRASVQPPGPLLTPSMRVKRL